jgi:hypothetical protein
VFDWFEVICPFQKLHYLIQRKCNSKYITSQPAIAPALVYLHTVSVENSQKKKKKDVNSIMAIRNKTIL